jgi:Ni,Fe-hydrogenase I cytochrome b subunit
LIGRNQIGTDSNSAVRALLWVAIISVVTLAVQSGHFMGRNQIDTDSSSAVTAFYGSQPDWH